MAQRDVPPDAALAALRAERARLVAHADALHRDLDGVVGASEASNADDEHDPEGATIAFERAQLTALLNATRARLAAVDAALHRVAAGSYGVCEHCGEVIAAARLAVRPDASACVRCAGRR